MSNIKIDYDVKSKEMDEMPRAARVDLEYSGELTLLLCNNFLDSEPTWEEAFVGEQHDFANGVKTNQRWCVGARVQIADGEEEAYSYTPAIIVSTNGTARGTDIDPIKVESVRYNEDLSSGDLVKKEIAGINNLGVMRGKTIGGSMSLGDVSARNTNFANWFRVSPNGRWLLTLEYNSSAKYLVRYEILSDGTFANRDNIMTIANSSEQLMHMGIYPNSDFTMYYLYRCIYNSAYNHYLRGYIFNQDTGTSVLFNQNGTSDYNFASTQYYSYEAYGLLPNDAGFYMFTDSGSSQGRILTNIFKPNENYTTIVVTNNPNRAMITPVWASPDTYISHLGGTIPYYYRMSIVGTTCTLTSFTPSWHSALVAQYPKGYGLYHRIDNKLIGYLNPDLGTPTYYPKFNPYIVCEIDPLTGDIGEPILSDEPAEFHTTGSYNSSTGWPMSNLPRGISVPFKVGDTICATALMDNHFDPKVKALSLVDNKLVKTTESVFYRNNSRTVAPLTFTFPGITLNTTAGLMFFLNYAGWNGTLGSLEASLPSVRLGGISKATGNPKTETAPGNVVGYGVAQETGLQGDWHNVVMFGEGE